MGEKKMFLQQKKKKKQNIWRVLLEFPSEDIFILLYNVSLKWISKSLLTLLEHFSYFILEWKTKWTLTCLKQWETESNLWVCVNGHHIGDKEGGNMTKTGTCGESWSPISWKDLTYKRRKKNQIKDRKYKSFPYWNNLDKKNKNEKKHPHIKAKK